MSEHRITIPCVCPQCGASFRARPLRFERADNPCCSKACAYTYRSIPNKPCLSCGVVFHPAEREQRFCSPPCYHDHHHIPAVDRFWAKVDTSGECWLWTGALVAGYGSFFVNNAHVKAHRFSYALVHGPIPDGLDCCHHCDNPPCVRPSHLFAGTRLENMQDMVTKGRGVPLEKMWMRVHPERVMRGETHVFAKLTQQQVNEIRSRYAAGGSTQSVLAAEYGVKREAIGKIVRGERWKDFP